MYIGLYKYICIYIYTCKDICIDICIDIYIYIYGKGRLFHWATLGIRSTWYVPAYLKHSFVAES